MTEGFKFPFSFPAKEKGRKRKLPADVRKRKNSLRESGEKNSPGAPVTGRSHVRLIRAKKPSRAAQTAFPLGRLSPSFFYIAFSHRPDFNSFSAAFLQPLSLGLPTLGFSPISVLDTEEKRRFLFVHSSQQREERTKKRRRCYRAYSFGRCCRRRGLRNSLRSNSPRPASSVGRRPPGPIKAVSPTGYTCCYFLNPSPRDWRPSVSPLYGWRHTEER